MRRNRKERNHKYINGTKGVISILLAALMLPFVLIAGALLGVGRMYSAVAIFDEALCNASNSTLGTYESFLKKRFGLLAIQQSSNGTVSDEAVQKFINGIFSDYMELNTGALSNTYFNLDCNAVGVYPLADIDVLETQVLEYSKYQVPLALVEDAIDLEELVKNIEKLIPGYALFSGLTSLGNSINSYVTLNEDIDILKNRTTTQDYWVSEYTAAYAAFNQAVSDYIAKREEWDEKKAELDASADQTEADAQKQSEEETSQGGNENVQVELDTLSEELAVLLEDMEEKKTAYLDAITKLKSALSAVMSTQQSVKSDIEALGSGIVNTVTNTATGVEQIVIDHKTNEKQENEKKIAQLEKEGGHNTEIADLEKKNQQIQKEINELAVGKQVPSAAISASQQAYQDIGAYEKVMDTERCNEILERLNALEQRIEAVGLSGEDGVQNSAGLPDGYNANILALEDDADYYVATKSLITASDVDELERQLLEAIVDSTGLAILKAIVNFWNALLNLGLAYSLSLNAEINMEYYNDTYGGLPSTKDRSLYPLTNTYAEQDSALSEYYQAEMGSYVSDVSIESVYDVFESIEIIMDDIQIIFNFVNADWSGLWGFISAAGDAYQAACDIFGELSNILQNLTVENLMNALRNRALVVGYIYNMTTCRTTYEKGTRLKSSFDSYLPPTGKEISNGVCFYGAEMEYIMFGSVSERENQESAFWMIYIIELLLDLIPTLSSSEMWSIFDSAMAIPFAGPVLAILILAAYIIVEPLIDTIIACNGGEIPLIKTCVYLTPSGLIPLMIDIANVDLPRSTVDAVANKIEKVSDEPVEWNSLTEEQKKQYSSGYFDVKYQHILMVAMLLSTGKTKMLSRLADIIEMECVYNAQTTLGSKGQFDLDYAYTYLRSSGSFQTTEFIPISDRSVLTSQTRVVYKGY